MKPHAGQPLVTAGTSLEDARAAMILVHGRGAAPANILDLATSLHHPDFIYLAPAAADHTWYPYSFMADTSTNEPGLSSGLFVIDDIVNGVINGGVPRERIILGGFSQGACLMSEFAVRHGGRFGGILAFSGALIGPPGTKWEYEGRFEGTPVFFGCSDVDSHVPEERVNESAGVFERMGAVVEKRIYPGMGHLINDDEIEYASDLVRTVGS